MDLQQMRYFLTVAETCNITAAARILHMAQPPLSRQIKQLEEELQVELFERKANRLYLTEAGVLLKRRAQEILSLTERSLQEIRITEQNTGYTLAIGTVASAGTMLLPKLVVNFKKLYPYVNFKLLVGETNRITELLEKNIIELGVVRYPFDEELFASCSLPKERLKVVFALEAFPELRGKQVLGVEELADYPLLIHRKYEGLLREIFAKHDCEASFFCQSDDIMPLFAWAEAGLGLAVLPESALDVSAFKALHCVDVADAEMVTTSALVWVKKQYRSKIADKFIEFFTAQIK